MQLTYNGVLFDGSHTLTTAWDERPILENGKYVYTRYRIGARVVLNREMGVIIDGVRQTGQPDDLLANKLRDRLHQSGAPLKVVGENGFVLIDVPEEDRDLDVTGGPRPIVVRVESFSLGSFVIDFQVETDVITCEVFSGELRILRNQWEVEVSYDENFFATHMVRGSLTINGDTERSALSEVFREWVHPLRPLHFHRTGFHYAMSADGTKLNYVFTDRQQYVVAPPPATKARGVYRETTQSNGLAYASLDIHMEGPPHVKKADLLTLASRVLVSYLTRGGTAPRVGHLEQSSISTTLWGAENILDVRAMWLKPQGGAGVMSFLGVRGADILRSLAVPTYTGEAADPGASGAFFVSTIHSKLSPPCESDQNGAQVTGQVVTVNPLAVN